MRIRDVSYRGSLESFTTKRLHPGQGKPDPVSKLVRGKPGLIPMLLQGSGLSLMKQIHNQCVYKNKQTNKKIACIENYSDL